MGNIKICLGLVFCLLIILFRPGLCEAEKSKLRVTVEQAEIRLKPDSGSMTINKAPAGAILDSDEQVGEWFKVSLPPDKKGIVITGFIHSSEVEVITEKSVEKKLASSPPSTPPPPSTQTPPPAQHRASQPTAMKFDIRFWGGMNYLIAGDVNDGVKGFIDEVHDDEFVFLSVEGEAKDLHLGFDFAADLIFHFNPQVGIGIGAGYIQGTQASDFTFTNGVEGIFTNKPKMSAIPLRLGIFFAAPLDEILSFSFNGGVGIYLANYSLDIWFEENGYWEDVHQEATAAGLGFHAGMGFEFNLAPNVAFFIEGQGRYAKISGFEGTFEYDDSGGGPLYVEKGKLYYYENNIMGKTYPRISISEDEPSASWVSNVREANVDFSGFNVVAGIKLKF
ncbi:MAG: outer membrane beta-barrel protein [Candidatus Aminicenantes bacterium]|nr:outer membrane beta-barrel protein [Candidatus Aminicenantes bacterium]